MASIRNAVIAMMVVCIGLQIVACNSLALSGDKRYKTEINNALLNVQDEFNKNGEISDGTKGKINTLLTKYEADYGGKGSYMAVKEMMNLIGQAEADAANGFSLYQQAMSKKLEAEDFLTTEIKD